MSANTTLPDKWLSFGLAFVGGFCDAAGFLLVKTFTGHITGSMVLGAIAVAVHDWRSALTHFSATMFFLAGIPLSIAISSLIAARPSLSLLPTALAIEVILITAAYITLGADPGVDAIPLICISLALGLQNGAFRRTGGISVHTNYLTGTITSLLAGQAERGTSPMASPQSTEPDRKIGLLYGIWGWFLLGAGTGAAMIFHFEARGILLVLVVLLGLMARALIAPQHAGAAT